MKLYDRIFERVLRSARILNVIPKRNAPVDPILKDNLPALMGRRDGCCDFASAIAVTDIFDLGDDERFEQYQDAMFKLDQATRDTASILGAISSPDTELRERWIADYIYAQQTLYFALSGLSGAQNLFEGDKTRIIEIIGHTADRSSDDANAVSEAELRLLGFLRDLCLSGDEKVMRYRSYARKSFSPLYGARYDKSYLEYAPKKLQN